jgi:hypothetical protein
MLKPVESVLCSCVLLFDQLFYVKESEKAGSRGAGVALL